MEVRREFTAEDTDFLSMDKYDRYLPSSDLVGHAVIVKDKLGNKQFKQFSIPSGRSSRASFFVPLLNFQEILRNGQINYSAESVAGTTMLARRFIYGEHDGVQFEVAFFSPRGEDVNESSFADDTIPVLFQPHNQGLGKAEEEAYEVDVQQQALNKPARIKGGVALVVEPQSVQFRIDIKDRDPNPYDVMEYLSARDAYNIFYQRWGLELSLEMREVLFRAIHASLRDSYKNFYRPEWAHIMPYILTPRSIEPQCRENLGALPKWANTEMMMLTHLVKWFALNCPTAVEKISSSFIMLLGSQLVEKVNYQVTIEDQHHTVRLFQRFSPFKKAPLFRKATDLVQSTAIVHAMLNDTPTITPTALSLFTPQQQKKSDKRSISEVESADEQDDEKRAKIEPQ